ncbi:MAG: MFS transporter, partial [bacterium]
GATSFAYLAGAASLGLFSVLMGSLADRFSVRSIAVVGSVSLGVFYLALSRMESLWELYLYYSLMGGLGSAALFSPLLAQIGKWFQGHGGMAIGLCTAAFSLAQSTMPSLSRFLITEYGWRGAYTALGWGCLAVLVPLVLLLRPAPAASESTTAMGPSNSLQSDAAAPNGVLWIAIAVVFCCICHATLLIHLVPLTQDLGVGSQQAAGLLTTVFVAGLFGRIVVGILSDRIGGLKSYMLFSLAQTIPIYGFLYVETVPALYLLAAVFGFFFGGVMVAIFTALEGYVPPERRGFSFGLVSLFGWTGMGMGGYQGGFFYDLKGDYHLSFQVAVLAGVVNLLILSILFYRSRPRLQEVLPAPA